VLLSIAANLSLTNGIRDKPSKAIKGLQNKQQATRVAA
jgi:hypothetical protein